jgi:hypothetical protein
MSLFRVISTPQDLPLVGNSIETGTFDLKGAVESDRHEMAKDVAALANASGGVLLIGAYENKGMLAKYAPMDRTVAFKAKDAYEHAVKELCRPVPVMDAVPIQMAAPEDWVVAVNVYGFPASAVGVLWNKDPEVYAFPLRVATHTRWMSPTEIPMLMIPQLRRAAILLDSIPADHRRNIWLMADERDDPANPFSLHVMLIDVDQLGTTVLFESLEEPIATRFSVPLDAVLSVWRPTEQSWTVSVDGHFARRDKEWRYQPRWRYGRWGG